MKYIIGILGAILISGCSLNVELEEKYNSIKYNTMFKVDDDFYGAGTCFVLYKYKEIYTKYYVRGHCDFKDIIINKTYNLKDIEIVGDNDE